MTRILTAVLVTISLVAPMAHGDEVSRMVGGMSEMRAGDWGEALDSAGAAGSVSWDVIEWHRLRAGRGSAADIFAFLKRRPDWPGLAYLRKRSEAAIIVAGDSAVRRFFAEQDPQTPEGVLAHAKVLIADGRNGDAEAGLVKAWRTMPMTATTQAAYLTAHRALLKPHHTARLDRLLWDGHLVSSRRMTKLVAKGPLALAEARMALQETKPGVDDLIGAVPASLRGAPGLAYDRFDWRMRKGRIDAAIELLEASSTGADALGLPGKWARQRVDLARRLMRAGDPERAYRLASRHFTTPEDGYVHADLEWLSGFLALRSLNDPERALDHFERFTAAVATPISLGRSGYWRGRALAALGRREAAQAAFAEGAKWQSSFYGLLAAERAGLPFDAELRDPPDLPPWRDAAFMDSSVLNAGLLLLAAGQDNLAERFLTHLVETLPPEQAVQLGRMAVEMNRAHLAVMIAKRAARRGLVLQGAYYPLHPIADLELPMAREMTLAIARRESEFDPVVISHAGARGLMQVMPKTARSVARDLGILAAHETARLTGDWEYNAKLGANYLAGLAAELRGNVVMMSAGYNAGPSRPLSWIARFGDPRLEGSANETAIVDWIEMIPFNETRNYVMRVTESLPVYRARLGKEPLPVRFSQELMGSTLLSFAP